EVFQCANGGVAIAAGNNALFEAFCKVIARESLLEDHRFLDTASRAEHQVELKKIVEEAIADRHRDELMHSLSEVGVPCGPINKFSEAVNDPQVTAMGWIEELELPNGSTTQTFGSPVQINGGRAPILQRPP